MPKFNGTAVLLAVGTGVIVTVFCATLTCETVALAGMPGPVTAMPTRMPAVEFRFWMTPLPDVTSPIVLAPVDKLPYDKLNIPEALVENVTVCTSGVPVVTIWYEDCGIS